MLRFTVHAGHAPSGGVGCGAKGLLDESAEARKVVAELMSLFSKHDGLEVVDCTVNENYIANEILDSLTRRMNVFDGMFNLSIHLNAGGGTGCECWCHNKLSDSVPLAQVICNQLSCDLGIDNRGIKYNQKLYVLRNTKAPTIIIECAFVDNEKDYERWDARIAAKAIAEAILDFFDIMETDIADVPAYKEENRDILYKVQLGAFSKKRNAKNLAIELERNGYKPYIKEEKK